MRWLGLLVTCLLPSAASAVSIPTDVVSLPAGDPVTLDLSSSPAEGAWSRLARDVDFSVAMTGAFDRGPVTPTTTDPWIFDLRFEITFGGLAGAAAASGPSVEEVLFTIQDMRLGSPTGSDPFASTSDLPTSGFVRGSFALDGAGIAPAIVRDDDGTITGQPEGFVGDCETAQAGCNRWVGFPLPGAPGTHVLTLEWALGERPPGDQLDFIFPNATLARITSVPEPGIAVLLTFGLAVAGLRQRRRGI